MPRTKREPDEEIGDERKIPLQNVVPVKDLTPLQKHGLELMEQVISVRKHYGEDSSDQDTWLLNATNRAVYAALIDCIDEGVGENAKVMLRRELVSGTINSKG